jgi:hypothetical protein
MRVTITVNVSMRKIISLPFSILFLFIVLLAQQSVFATSEYVVLSVNELPTNPTRPRALKAFPVSCIVTRVKKLNINNSQFVNLKNKEHGYK